MSTRATALEHPSEVRSASGFVRPGAAKHRQKMMQECTDVLAAAFIAHPDFPAERSLPPIVPPPFTSLGHQLLFDYPAFAAAVWGVAMPLVHLLKMSRWLQQLGPLAVAALAFGGLAGFGLVRPSWSAAPAVVSFFVARYAFAWLLARRIATARRQAIVRLLAGQHGETMTVPAAVHERLQEIRERCGDGNIGTYRVPVLVTTKDTHPFPGYGRLQNEITFVCPPSQESKAEASFARIEAEVLHSVVSASERLAIPDLVTGQVVALDGRTLQADSRWVTGRGFPPLWLDERGLPSLAETDPRASARAYQAIEIMFPLHESVATLFVRVFPAGNAVACHVALATLGPLIEGRRYCLERLQKLNAETRRRRWWRFEAPRARGGAEQRFIDFLRAVIDRGEPFQRGLHALLRGAKPLFYPASYLQRADGADVAQVIADSVQWPGHYLSHENFREGRSFTMTTDFFGKSEVIAAVTTCYEQTVSAVLDSIKGLGFDVSKYQDGNGRYEIHAERIEQLVVGERIQIGDGAPLGQAPKGVDGDAKATAAAGRKGSSAAKTQGEKA